MANNTEIEEIIIEICNALEVDKEKIEGKRGSDTIFDARSLITYILHVNKGYSIKTLTDYFDCNKRDVYKRAAKIRDGLKLQPFYRNMYRELIEKLPHME